MHFPRLLLVCVGVISCAGCVGCVGFFNPAAESSVSVRGKITNVQPDTTCSVRLLTDKGRVAGEFTTRPQFHRSFVVAPGDRTYYVDVSCAGQPGRFRSTTYQLGGGRRVLDLGPIVLK
jgi:hypothetical protein